jgi:tetratricopeptide (TPR) repeat protein
LSKHPIYLNITAFLGQIHSETGDQEEAVNCLIDALKWNPKNEWALLMMGNIYARFKDDVETAITFYEQILSIKPDDHLALKQHRCTVVAKR